MFKKIILTFVLLISAQQEFYAMQINNDSDKKEAEISKEEISKEIKFWSDINSKYIKGLKWLWMFLDNVPFQYGCSKIWKDGEAYYGLSNGIGFFPSILNFGWLKIGFVDVHINVINAIINYIRIYIAINSSYYTMLNYDMYTKHISPIWFNSLKWWLFYTLLTDTQLLSFKFFNCVKIKIISIGAIVTYLINDVLTTNEEEWFFNFFYSPFYNQLSVPSNFFLLSTRIEINISEIINHFKKQ